MHDFLESMNEILLSSSSDVHHRMYVMAHVSCFSFVPDRFFYHPNDRLFIFDSVMRTYQENASMPHEFIQSKYLELRTFAIRMLAVHVAARIRSELPAALDLETINTVLQGNATNAFANLQVRRMPDGAHFHHSVHP